MSLGRSRWRGGICDEPVVLFRDQAGRAAALVDRCCHRAAPLSKREGGVQFRLFHGLTPEAETSCFHFWSCANGYRQNEPEATEQLYREIAPQGLVNIVSDTNRVVMRRFIERLLADEKGALAAE
jgi:phenylpropionate dioxygenase-like ring-hydroxylating dioxygenase large terminal subunit